MFNCNFQCVEVLEQWQSTTAAKATAAGETIAAAEELTALLTSYEMEGLFLAHDSIISSVDGFQAKNSSSSPSGPPSPSSSIRDSHVADNIKIIRIEKTNEPLGATVRNEGDAVIIGELWLTNFSGNRMEFILGRGFLVVGEEFTVGWTV